MGKTVVAIYNSVKEAHRAGDELLNNGFNSHDIDICSGKQYEDISHSEENSISLFFRNLFGIDDDRNEKYSSVAKVGCIVTVYAHSDDEAKKASGILDEYGAIDVDENYHNRSSTKDRDIIEGINYEREYNDRDNRNVEYDNVSRDKLIEGRRNYPPVERYARDENYDTLKKNRDN